jgi:hypothetical protein
MSDTLEHRSETIIGKLLSLPDTARAAAAARMCGKNAELLRRVMSLITAETQAEGFMEAVPSGGASSVAPVGEKTGDTIGRYKLLEKIGEGGFGVVFTAEQQKPVRRLVALKVIKLGMDTREVVARFEAERQALAMMDHPNIAKVLDGGATETGRPYFVMELVRGLPITEYADKHKMSTRQRVELAAQVCRAVQHAHSKGIIHRDLKPTNVLVTTADDKPVPKVIDFGIAKATQSRLTDRTLYTAHRQLIGTPQYMSPEQADSEGADLDTRSDVYSLGVLVYELLVGTTPMDARQLRSAAYEAMRKMIRETEPARPSTRIHTMAGESLSAIAANRGTEAKKLEQAIHGELDWIVMKALEKDRSRRYDTAAAMADDLNRYLSGDAVLAGPVSGVYRLKKTLRRYKAAAIISGAIAACLLLGVAGTTWGLVQARQQKTKAETNAAQAIAAEHRATDQATLAEAEKQEALAQKAEADRQKQLALASERDAKTKGAEAKATLDFFTGLLAKASPNQTKDATVSQVLVDKLIKPALATIDRQFKNQPLVRASIQSTLARTLYELGRYDLSEQQAKAAYDARQHLLPADHSDTLGALNNYANAINAQGRYAEAERLLKQCWDARRRVLGDDHPDTLAALMHYAGAIYAQGRPAEAEPLCKQCWDASRRVLGDDHPDTLAALNGYAVVINAQGRHAEAERLCKQLWDTSRRVRGDDHPDTLMALNDYAIAIYDQGRYAEAERLYKQCWDTSRRVRGDDHPDTLTALNNYANAIDLQGRHAEAEPLFKQGWDACRRAMGDDHPETLRALNGYAAAIDAQGRHAEAEPLFKQCWDAQRRVQGDDHPDTLRALNNYAGAIYAQGRHAEAERLFKQCWDAQRRVQGNDHPETLAALNGYAAAINDQGRYAEAEPLYKQCWDARRRLLGEDHPDTLAALNNYAGAIGAQGRYAEAEPLFKQCWDARRRVLGDDHPDTLTALYNYARAIAGLGRYAGAEPLFKQCWDASRRVRGDDHPDTLGALNNYAVVISGQGRHAEAERLYKQCWDAYRRVLGDNDPLTIQVGRNYAAAGRAAGLPPDFAPATRPGETAADRIAALETAATAATGLDGNQADALCRKAIALLRQQTPIDEKRIAADEVLEAGPLLTVGQKFSALRCLRDAVAIDKRLLGPRDPVTVAAAKQLADQLDEKHPEEAAAVRADAGLAPATQPAPLPAAVSSQADAKALYDAAITNANSGHASDAIAQLKTATDYYRQSAPDDTNGGPALHHLGQFLANKHQWPEAEAVARENYQWDQAHPSPDRKPGTVPGSLKLLNQILKHEGKPLEPAPATQPAK